MHYVVIFSILARCH